MEKKEDVKNVKNNEILNLKNISNENIILEENGYIAKINEEIFNPDEVSILIGDSMTREITQLIQFLCESYPFEAIDYCLKRCYYKSLSKTSLLDKIIKYLLDKYKNKENSEYLIYKLIFTYKKNILQPKLSSVTQFNLVNNNDNKQMTKIIYYDQSKEDVSFKNTQNEIFIEIDKNYVDLPIIKNDLIPLKEKENNIIEIFLCDKRYLYKRFCRRSNYIYIYNFYKYEKINYNLNKKKKKKNLENNNEEENSDKIEAIFICEQKNCNAKYKYNFSTNRFSEIKPHMNNIEHDIIKNAPSYYDENIKILTEKPYITDIQLVVIDS